MQPDDDFRPASRWQHLHHGLTTWNDILLVPMFTLIVLETTTENLHELVDVHSANLAFCAFFLAEWVLGLAVARDRYEYLRSPLRLIDLISSIPFGIFQSARFVRLIRIARLVRVILRVRRARGRGAQILRMIGVLGSTTFAGALALNTVEPQTVPRLSDALWWSLTTITTVGYGDIAPSTGAGRIIASVLMTCGIGAFGYVAGIMSALLQDPQEDEVLGALRRIEQRLDELSNSHRSDA
jgi:voltage-gated potassium channel